MPSAGALCWPVILFKYFSPAKIRDFVAGHVSLTPPKYLNDPFEFAVRRVPATQDELELLFDGFVADQYAAISVMRNTVPCFSLEEFKTYQLREIFPQWAANVTGETYVESEPRYMQEGLSDMLGVVCMAEIPDDVLMWAHYAGGHRGFVAEFECSESKELNGVELALTAFGEAFRVVYRDESPVLKSDHSNVVECFTTKATKWSYEREWRVVRTLNEAQYRNEMGHYFVNFHPSVLRSVIRGSRMQKEDEARLLKLRELSEYKHLEIKQPCRSLFSAQLELNEEESVLESRS